MNVFFKIKVNLSVVCELEEEMEDDSGIFLCFK